MITQDASLTKGPVRAQQTGLRPEARGRGLRLRGHQGGLQGLRGVLPENHPLQFTRLVLLYYR